MSSWVIDKGVRKSPAAAGRKSIFTGLVYCADCGFKMRSHNETRKYSDGHTQVFHSFVCGNYSRSGKTACTIHMIYEDVLSNDMLYKHNYSDFEKVKNNWDELYRNADISVKVQFSIKRPGIILRPAYNQ